MDDFGSTQEDFQFKKSMYRRMSDVLVQRKYNQTTLMKEKHSKMMQAFFPPYNDT